MSRYIGGIKLFNSPMTGAGLGVVGLFIALTRCSRVHLVLGWYEFIDGISTAPPSKEGVLSPFKSDRKFMAGTTGFSATTCPLPLE